MAVWDDNEELLKKAIRREKRYAKKTPVLRGAADALKILIMTIKKRNPFGFPFLISAGIISRLNKVFCSRFYAASYIFRKTNI